MPVSHGVQRRTRVIRIIVTAMLLALTWGEPGDTATDCRGLPVKVSLGADAAEASVCAGVRKALLALEQLELVPQRPVRIEVVDELPEMPPQAVGCYDATKDTVYLLDPTTCRIRHGDDGALGVPYSGDLYESFVAHEVAHAVVEQHLSRRGPAPAVHEYIAGVIQLMSLSPEEREVILSREPGDGFDAPREIAIVIYEFDPARFAVESYRHYLKLEDGPGFVRALLSGSIQIDFPTP